ncbi:hypothetical protein RZE82_08345 [Mollicutes bacterium LVI A0039]|nr:hypothetical protein RZE82_08345 [Mollicutes bacterium LVI A0039]
MREFFKRDFTPYVIGGFLIILVVSIFLSYNKPLTYKMTYSENPTVDSPVTVDFEVNKRMSHYSPQTFTVELTHKYNSNETYTFDLAPYEVGRYEFIFTPSYSGDYLVKLKLNIDGTTQYFNETINIQQ